MEEKGSRARFLATLGMTKGPRVESYAMPVPLAGEFVCAVEKKVVGALASCEAGLP